MRREPGQVVIPLISSFFRECMQSLCDCFHKLAFDADGEHMTDDFQDRRLLAVLSNLIHSKEVVLNRLWNHVRKLIVHPFQHIVGEQREDIIHLLETLELWSLTITSNARPLNSPRLSTMGFWWPMLTGRQRLNQKVSETAACNSFSGLYSYTTRFIIVQKRNWTLC